MGFKALLDLNKQSADSKYVNKIIFFILLLTLKWVTKVVRITHVSKKKKILVCSNI